jgi:hypothetical protein
MSHIDPELVSLAETHPDDLFAVIVRVEGDLDTRQDQLEEIGLLVTRRLRLIQGFAARGRGKNIQAATEQDWVISIEIDSELRTMTSL